jgi:D-alanyl-D-alanine carboxypeptidase
MVTLGAMLRRGFHGDRASRLVLSLAAASLFAACAGTGPAEARHRAHHATRHVQRHVARHPAHSIRYMQPRAFAPNRNFAAIVVDGNSGEILYARDEDAPRHPASITKVMTLYLLFEQLERGRLSLDSEIPVSRHAAAQKPTKLGLRPGETIIVEDAIKAVVTRSANDIAVAIAEAIGGDEDRFADLMTRKAHELGMSRTRFVNASGLPDDAQITTARDLATLGRVIQERFPRYYRYFSTHAFYYAGATILNHNHLMDRVEGMDGIKTGYTRASGFNLLTSVKRNGHYILAVVMGGVSAPSRDRIMANLIEDQIDNGASIRTASAISGNRPPDLPPRPRTDAPPGAEPDLPMRPQMRQEAQDTPRPAPKPLLAYAEGGAAMASNVQALAKPVRVASIAPDAPVEKPRPAAAAGLIRQMPVIDATATIRQPPSSIDALAKTAALEGPTTQFRDGALASAPSVKGWIVGPAPAKDRRPAEQPAFAKAEPAPAASLKAAESRRPAAARSGWMIQIGATDDLAKANALLAKAKIEGRKTLSAAQPFTEAVQKGSETLYRARFAGLEADSAELACKTLKRTGFSCFATKN